MSILGMVCRVYIHTCVCVCVCMCLYKKQKNLQKGTMPAHNANRALDEQSNNDKECVCSKCKKGYCSRDSLRSHWNRIHKKELGVFSSIPEHNQVVLPPHTVGSAICGKEAKEVSTTSPAAPLSDLNSFTVDELEDCKIAPGGRYGIYQAAMKLHGVTTDAVQAAWRRIKHLDLGVHVTRYKFPGVTGRSTPVASYDDLTVILPLLTPTRKERVVQMIKHNRGMKRKFTELVSSGYTTLNTHNGDQLTLGLQQTTVKSGDHTTSYRYDKERVTPSLEEAMRLASLYFPSEVPVIQTSGKYELGLVYFIRAKGTSFVKIGYTRNLPQRLQTLQTACPHALEVDFSMKTRDFVALERKLHQENQSRRVHGEWFTFEEGFNFGTI
jgi:hypothetical protein